jgi:pyrroline-5-carboxylate reductase
MNDTTTTIAVLGAGQMGGALVRGWVQAGAITAKNIRLYDVNAEAARALAEATGAATAQTPTEAVNSAKVALVSVKPYVVAQSLSEISAALPPDCPVVSIAAGVRLAALQSALPPSQPVIRVMPNTPALVGEGASAFCRGEFATEEHAALVSHLFGAVGKAFEVTTEAQLDAVIGVSGSGPAYFYLIIEALSDGGVRAGLPRDVARTLAAQTALGAAKMVLETGQHPAVLKDAVTTPGGTTIAALEVLEAAGLRGTLIEAVRAAMDRAREMG